MENQAPTVRSNVILAIERTWAFSLMSHTCAHVTRFYVRVHAPVRTSSAVLRSNAPLLRSNALAAPATYACMRSIVLPALERTSTSCINIPEAVCIFLFVAILINC
jgi:hypothetical protein